jgi:SAM-dependent methyltransferase
MASTGLQELNSLATPLPPLLDEQRKGPGGPGWISSAQVSLLRWVAPSLPGGMNGGAYAGNSKLLTLLPGVAEEIKGKVVLDFGCGAGAEAREMAARGAKTVIGLDRSEKWLGIARKEAEKDGFGDKCRFVTEYDGLVDVIISLDCFEHFGDPEAVLNSMYCMLKPGGSALISFGPTWYHPLGGHLFSVFPWAHILFREDALIRWRSKFKSDGARRFGEVEGGLNQMTIGRFENILAQSAFKVEKLALAPIRRTKPLHNHLTREFLTATVRCRLRKPELGYC